MENIVTEKLCTKCKEIKSRDEFYPRRDTKSGISSWCKDCDNKKNKRYSNLHPEKARARAKRYEQRHPERLREKQLRQYGIGIQEYNAILKSQNGVCDICKKDNVRFHVDHNHQSGVVRGILCENCNRMIGMAKDSETILKRAIGYLKKHNAH